MLTISRNTLSGIAPGFTSLDDSWIGIYDAFSFGGGYPLRSDKLKVDLQIPDWGGVILDYLYSARDAAAQAVAFQALDQAIAARQLATSGRTDVYAFLARLKATELAREYGYYLRGGVDLQELADQLPGNLRIGQAGGAGGLLIGADVLGRVKALSAEAALPEGEGSSLNDNTQSPAPGTAAAVWADYGTWIVAGAVALVIGIIYHRWVR